MHDSIRQLVIVGGGTAGWMCAAAMSKILGDQVAITLIESDDIGTVGVGESTIPMIRLFNQVLGIDEDEFMRETKATFKLGIEFLDWGKLGDRYLHAFGRIGQDLGTLSFYQYWLRLHLAGKAPDLGVYSMNSMAARQVKFMRPDTRMVQSPIADIVYGFHVDAGLYARYLRKFSENRGVVRIEGKVTHCELRSDDGFIEAVAMEDTRRIAGDLFIDCSGFRSLLLGEALNTGYEDYSRWLVCDRAYAVPCGQSSVLLPYTRATARPAGWQWRIGLQHRTGNGHVYSSKFMSDDEAAAVLLANLDGPALTEPRLLRFTSGKRKKIWNKNVVAIGLSSGFMEPLESTSIHLVQTTIARLISFFPTRAFHQPDIDEFNRQADFEVERIRDFLILHYSATERRDTPFWDHCRTMEVPDRLRQKLDLYRTHGRIVRNDNELFAEVGWLQVMHGQGIKACGYHPLADLLSEQDAAAFLAEVAGVVAQCAAIMPGHSAYLDRILER